MFVYCLLFALSRNASRPRHVKECVSALGTASKQPDQQIPEGVCQKRRDCLKDVVIETQLPSLSSCMPRRARASLFIYV